MTNRPIVSSPEDDEDFESISSSEEFEQVTMSKKKTRTWSKFPVLQKPNFPEVEPNTIGESFLLPLVSSSRVIQ